MGIPTYECTKQYPYVVNATHADTVGTRNTHQALTHLDQCTSTHVRVITPDRTVEAIMISVRKARLMEQAHGSCAF